MASVTPMALTKINSRGFALVEVGMALPILLIALTGVFTVVYLFIAQAWLKDAGEEAALCVAEMVQPHVCKSEFMSKTQTILPVGRFTRLSVAKNASHILVKYSYQAARLTIENEITLRLPVAKRAVGKL